MLRGEIYLASFPFGNAPGMKLRPVLMLTSPLGSSAEVIVAYISSVIPRTFLTSDILLDAKSTSSSTTGLKVRSLLRLHKLATIHRSVVKRYMGNLDKATMDDIDAKLILLFSL